jgi:hypothetical protein
MCIIMFLISIYEMGLQSLVMAIVVTTLGNPLHGYFVVVGLYRCKYF